MQDSGNPAVIENVPEEFAINVSGNPNADGDISGQTEVNLADYEFPALGDYKFIVKETDSEDLINYPIDGEKEYYFYVSVRNKMNDGKPTGEYIATLSGQARNHDTGDKMYPIFESNAQRSHVSVTNTVSGNLANKDDYFKYKITIEGARDGDVFTVSGQSNTVDYGGETITTNNTITIDGTDDYIYLKHGQTVVIGSNGEKDELPINVKYRLEEVDAKGYVQYVDGVAGAISELKTVSTDAESASNRVDFINHKEGDVLTGIVMNVLPYAFAVAFTGFALAIVHVNKKKQRKTKCLK